MSEINIIPPSHEASKGEGEGEVNNVDIIILHNFID